MMAGAEDPGVARDPTGREALRGARILRRDLRATHDSVLSARRASKKLARMAYWEF